MHMIVFSIKFHQFGFKILAYARKYDLQLVKYLFCEYAASVSGNKDQMNMKHKNTMSSRANIIEIFH